MTKSMISIMLILLLIIAGIGCIDQKEKNVSTTATDSKKNIEKIEDIDSDNDPIKELTKRENLDKEWYKYTYSGPTDIENSERARMSIIPHLEGLGWTGGIDVVEMRSNISPNISNAHYIVIALPFTLSSGSIDYINQTLANYNFKPLEINVTVQ